MITLHIDTRTNADMIKSLEELFTVSKIELEFFIND